MNDPSSFKPFGFDHGLMLAALLFLGIALGFLASRMSEKRRINVGKCIGILLIAYGVVAYTRAGIQGILSWRDSLPLHLCNWVLIACIATLFRPSALGFELAYFWGLTGTVQALITPDLPQGFPSWAFFQFFWSHGGILLAIVFMMVGLKLRPRRGSVFRMFAAINLYAASVGILNSLFGWNYGYLCHSPSRPSLIDHLGPWPWYIASMEGIAVLSFWILDLPWHGHRSNGENGGP